jgi:hypothetical protein
MADFSTYDDLDAKEAADHTANIKDDEDFRAHVAHEFERAHPRSTVLTREVTERFDRLNVAEQQREGKADGPQVDINLAKDANPGAVADALQGSLRDVTAEDIAPSRDSDTHNDSEDGDPVKETVKALLAERRGYEMHGENENVAEVNKELSRLGHKGEKPQDRAATRTKKDTAAGKDAAARKRS